jgi:hypothetical protein
MTNDALTSLLAHRVLGWIAAPDRYLVGKRRWLPRWRFQPTKSLEDAFRLLEGARPDAYTMSFSQRGGFSVNVRIAGTTGHASDSSKPRAITLAIARALGVEVDSSQ